MRLRPTDDETAVQDLFAGFFANESPTEVVRAAEPLGFDTKLWAALQGTGAPGMALPEQVGGGGATLTDLASVAIEWGRRLAPVPLIEHAVGARLLASADALTPEIVSGEQIVTLALRPSADGVFGLVPAGAIARHVVGLHHDTPVLVSAPGPEESPRNTADAPVADRSAAEAVPLGALDHTAWRQAVNEWQALMALALTGLGSQALDLGVAYVKERHQFGVPVGSFQAVQHRLADSAVRLQGAHLLAHKAIWAAEHLPHDAGRLAPMAFLFAAETAKEATAASLQFHGGYGYAEEYDIQLYWRRARGWALTYGSLGREYQRLADITLGTAGAA